MSSFLSPSLCLSIRVSTSFEPSLFPFFDVSIFLTLPICPFSLSPYVSISISPFCLILYLFISLYFADSFFSHSTPYQLPQRVQSHMFVEADTRILLLLLLLVVVMVAWRPSCTTQKGTKRPNY